MSAGSPTLDVVVPSANDPTVVGRCLRALSIAVDLAAVPRPRVTIVDDRPGRDGLVELAATLGFSVVTGGGLGVAGARNRGAAQGSSDFVVFVDDNVELDRDALLVARKTFEAGVDVVVGGLRPPAGSPRWLTAAYADGSLTDASALLPAGEIPSTALGGGLVAIRRASFEDVGGFPTGALWGWEDALLGLSLDGHRPARQMIREPRFGGIHHYVPTWSAWLERQRRSGSLLREVERRLGPEDAALILSAVTMDGSWRSAIKLLLGRLPDGVAEHLAIGKLRKVAAAAAFAHGYLHGS